jgi:type II secretory pathway pseudopilin PulG
MENVTGRSAANEEGFSLLEMAASLSILLLISGVVFTGLKSYQNSYYSQQMQTDVHQDLRGAMELMCQEIGQAGLVPVPATLPTLSAAVTSSTSAQAASISSAVSFYQGEYLVVDTGSSQETVALTAVNYTTNQISGIFTKNHSSGAIVSGWGAFLYGILSGAASPGNNTLELFGDINSTGHITYVQYDCNFSNGTLTRTSTDILNTTTTMSSKVVLINNLVNSGTDCFQYTNGVPVGANTVYPTVAVTLTVQTNANDPQTGQPVQVTKTLLNINSRNVLAAIAMYNAGATTEVQPTPTTFFSPL